MRCFTIFYKDIYFLWDTFLSSHINVVCICKQRLYGFQQNIIQTYKLMTSGMLDVHFSLVFIPVQCTSDFVYVEFALTSQVKLPTTLKDRPLVKFKQYLYYEEADKPQQAAKTLEPVKDAKVGVYMVL